MNPSKPPEEFEEIYPRYEFAPLVRIALFLAEHVKGRVAPRIWRTPKKTDHHPVGSSRSHWN